MRITEVHARFFRAFNIDHLRKAEAKPDATHRAWEEIDGRFFPYVRVPVDAEVTCIVGANESGKSQLLKIVRQALLVDQRDTADFCRYSEMFTVSERLKSPHVGMTLRGLTAADSELFNSVEGISGVSEASTVRLFRQGAEHVDVYLDEEVESLQVKDMAALSAVLPRVVEIDPELRLPDAIPIDYLINAAAGAAATPVRVGLAARIGEALRGEGWLASVPIPDPPPDPQALALGRTIVDQVRSSPEPDADELAQYDLAYKLLTTCGGVDPSTFEAVRSMNARPDRKAFVSALEHDINRQLEQSLNLASWWTQDQRFRMSVKIREFEIALMISDRTDFEYSFDERSSGLRYFLSYLVQYFSHLKARDRDARHEVLLMDEPDAYLSNAAQQDLLRLFQHFADGASEDRAQQVMYVTHSPFLIDKNRPTRVRVLDKGYGEQGTRLVADTSRNHFEPLRSAFGSFVAETVYIGHCNLIMEGSADHVYLANLSRLLLDQGAPETDRIDLNEVTLVPAGSAQHACYLTYLARGRDASQPAVVVMFDGDDAGRSAAESLKKQKIDGVKTIPNELILVLNEKSVSGIITDRPGGVLEIEDLIPASVAAIACTRYAEEIGLPDPKLDAQNIVDLVAVEVGLLDAVGKALEASGSNLRLDKVPFALHVVGVLKDSKAAEAEVSQCIENFAALFRSLTALQRDADRRRFNREVSRRTDRAVRSFLRDYPDGCTKARLRFLIEEIEHGLDDTKESEAMRNELRLLEHSQTMRVNLDGPVVSFVEVERRLTALSTAGIRASQDE